MKLLHDHASIHILSILFGGLLAAMTPTVRGQLISPNAISVSTPSGSNDTTDPYTDDVLLDSITFGSITLSSSGGQIEAIQSAFVVSGRTDTNAEWGDNDDNADGNDNPFARVGINVFLPGGGVDTSVQESTDPLIQDIALASAFSSLSLSEITDGEGNTSVTNFIFNKGIMDNDNTSDLIPEIVLFERGNNDTTTVRAIIGGTFNAPILAGTGVSINSGDMWNTGVRINTTEISNDQELASIGIDLNGFGITDGTVVYGLQIETDGGDFGGFFQAAEDPASQFIPNVPPELLNPDALIVIPEPGSVLLVAIAGLVSLVPCFFRRAKRRYV
jgi:hypothetical protein